MNKYRLSASILSFILAVSALPAGATANEIRPRAASESEETIMIEEPADSDEAGEINEIEDTVEAAESESEDAVEESVSETVEAVEPEDPGAVDAAGTEDAEDAGNKSGTVVTHEVRLPSGQEGILIRSAGSAKVSTGESFTFYLSPAEGWQKGKNFSVKAGETVLKPVPVKTADTDKKTDPENPDREDGTHASESAESPSGTDTDSGADTEESSKASEGASGAQDPLEKKLISQGYEKYVITRVTGDITVSVTGVEKIAASETKNPEEGKEKGAGEEQEPVKDSHESSEEQEQQEQSVEDENVESSSPQEVVSGDQDLQGQDSMSDSGMETTDMDGSGDLPDYEGQVFSEEPAFSDAGDNIVPGTDETLVPGTDQIPVPGSDEGSLSNPEEIKVPGEEDTAAGEETAAADGQAGEESNSLPADGEGPDQSTGDMNGETVSDTPAFAGSTSENSAENATEDAQPAGTVPLTAPAKTVDEYPLWVGGVRANETNCKDIAGNGTISYDNKNKILKFKDATVKGRKEAAAPVYYNGAETLTIDFSGNCSITDTEAGSGIVCENSSLILSGTGSLTVRTAAPLSGACIKADKGELTISKGTVTAVSSDSGPGLSASKITIGNDATRVEAGSASKAVSAGSEISIGSLLWITTPSGGKLSDDKKTITTETGKTADQAVIEPRPVYEVKFDPGEGSGDMESKHVVMGQKLELPECTFTAPQCKAFSGWKVGDQVYKAGDSVTVTKNFTATAQWKDAHSLKKIAKKNPTCLEKGRKEYYKCEKCGKCFSDSAASKPIKESDTIIPALGHKWGEPTYTWAKDYSTVTAKRVCERDKTHIESEKVKTTKKGTDPTCTKEGKYTYTAVFSNKAFEKQIKNVKKAALGHNWGKHEFIWTQNDDGSFDCACRFTCTRDSSHKKTVDADVKESLTLPTKSADGRLYCTAKAELNDKEYTDTLEEAISPAGSSGYRFTKASDTWKHGSKDDLDFTVKRYEYDMITYRAFSHILVDGRTVSTAYYDTWEGSLKLEIDDRYLNLLDAGRHTLTVEFKDGSVSRSFEVKDASSKGSPSTGDNSDSLLWVLSFVSCAAVIAAMVTLKRRKK